MIIAVQFLGGLGQLALSTRILGAEGFGVLVVIIAVTLLVYRFMSMPGFEAITTYITRSVAGGRLEDAVATLRFTLGAAMGLALLAYGLLVAFTVSAGGLIGIEKTHESAMLVYGVTGIFMATHMESLAVLRLVDRMALGLAVTIAGSLTLVTALVAVWLSDGGLFMVSLALVAGAAVNGTGMLLAATVSARRAGLPGLLSSMSVRVPPDVIRFQIASFFQAKVSALSESMDVILVVMLTSATQAGFYRGALSIVTATRLPVRPIAEGVQAEYSRRWYDSDGAGFRRLSRRFTMLSVTIAIMIYGLLAIFHKPVIRVILGPGFEEAAGPLLILIPGAFIWMSISALRVLPAATGHATPSLIWTSAAVIVQVSAIFLLVPTYLAEGAAWARTFYFLVVGVIVIPFAVSTLRRSYRVGGASTGGDEVAE